MTCNKPRVPTELGTDPVSSLLFRYAIPAIIAMVAASTYNIVDSIFVGRGVGDLAISGMAVTNPFVNLSTALGTLVGVGSSTLISMRLGQGRYDTAQQVLGHAISLNLVIGILFTLVCLPLIDDILFYFGASQATLPYAHNYMRILLLGNVLTHCYYGLNAVIRSAGHPRTAMWCTFLTIALNTALDPLFIFVFHWGVEGAAWATVLAQAVALAIELKLLSRKSELLHLRPGIYALRWNIARQTLSIGLSPFAMHLAACLVVLVCNNQLLRHGGDMAIGAYGIVNRILFLFVTVVMGINQGLQPIVGYNWGARLNHRVRAAVGYGMAAASVVTVCAFGVAELMPEPVILLFGTGPELTRLSVHTFRIVSLMFPVVGVQIVIGNFFQSIGHVGKSIFLTLTRQLIFLTPLLWLLPRWWGLNGVLYAMPISDSMSAVVAIAMMAVQVKRMKKVTPQ